MKSNNNPQMMLFNFMHVSLALLTNWNFFSPQRPDVGLLL
jgi:hypothetical protein